MYSLVPLNIQRNQGERDNNWMEVKNFDKTGLPGCGRLGITNRWPVRRQYAWFAGKAFYNGYNHRGA